MARIELSNIGGGGTTLSLTTTGTSGASTLAGSVLNIPVYQGQLTLTTTGTSGAATLVGDTLNIPQYSGGGGTPAGSTGEIQYNNAGAFGASSNFAWDNSNVRLNIGAPSAPTARLNVRGGGTTSATVNFRLTDSGNTELVKVLDNGSINLTTGFFYNAPTSSVIIGTSVSGSTPTDQLEVYNSAVSTISVHSGGTGANGRAAFSLARVPSLGSTSETGWQFLKDASDNFAFRSLSAGTPTERAQLTTSGNFLVGTTSAGARLNVRGSSPTTGNALLVENSTPVDIYTIGNNGKISYWATNTAAGTTGPQTINRPSGTVNFGIGASALVVTNSLCTTSSIVFATVRTNDATAYIKNVVPAAGSFTINLGANATAETSVGFFIIN